MFVGMVVVVVVLLLLRRRKRGAEDRTFGRLTAATARPDDAPRFARVPGRRHALLLGPFFTVSTTTPGSPTGEALSAAGQQVKEMGIAAFQSAAPLVLLVATAGISLCLVFMGARLVLYYLANMYVDRVSSQEEKGGG